MKTQGKLWIVFNSETKTQTKPMSVVQAQVLLLSLSTQESHKYFLWTPGWDEWVCVKEFLRSEQRYFVIEQPPKPTELPEETLTKTYNTSTSTRIPDSPYTHVVVGEAPLRHEDIGGYHEQDFNGDELDLSKIKKIKPDAKKKKSSDSKNKIEDLKGPERRRDTRHNFKIEVVLVSKVRSFRTYSKNISLSGTMLEDAIPKEFLNTHFDLIIVNPFEPDRTKSRLLFRAKIVGDMVDHRRLMFIEQDVDMTKRLEALLKAYVAYQTQIKKGAG